MSPLVTLIIAIPSATPVTIPVVATVAMSSLLLANVAPVTAAPKASLTVNAAVAAPTLTLVAPLTNKTSFGEATVERTFSRAT